MQILSTDNRYGVEANKFPLNVEVVLILTSQKKMADTLCVYDPLSGLIRWTICISADFPNPSQSCEHSLYYYKA